MVVPLLLELRNRNVLIFVQSLSVLAIVYYFLGVVTYVVTAGQWLIMHCYLRVTSRGIARCNEVGNLPNMYGMGWTECVVLLIVEVPVPICCSNMFFWKNASCVFFLCLCLEVVLCDLLRVLHLYFSLPGRGFSTFDICVSLCWF